MVGKLHANFFVELDQTLNSYQYDVVSTVVFLASYSPSVVDRSAWPNTEKFATSSNIVGQLIIKWNLLGY